MSKNNDTISRRAAIEAVEDLPNCYNGYSDTYDKAFIIGVLEEQPSAQPEIIMCKECKYWREGDAYSYCQKLFNCGVLDVYDYMREEDDFCSLAERREGGKNEQV